MNENVTHCHFCKVDIDLATCPWCTVRLSSVTTLKTGSSTSEYGYRPVCPACITKHAEELAADEAAMEAINDDDE